MSAASSPSHPRIFVSHAHADNDLCDRYVAALRARGLDVWYDRTNLQGGQRLGQEISRELEQRSALVVLLTPASVASYWVDLEVSAFRDLAAHDPSRMLIPVRIADCTVPTLMRGLVWIDAVNLGFDAAIDSLAKALGVPKQEPRSQPRPLPLQVNQESGSDAKMQAEHPTDDTAGTSAERSFIPTPAPAPLTLPASSPLVHDAPAPVHQYPLNPSSPGRTGVVSAPKAPAQPAPDTRRRQRPSRRVPVIISLIFVFVLSSLGALLLYWHSLATPKWSVVTGATTDFLTSISMVSATEGWAVGESGTILHCSGGHWSKANSPTSLNLDSISMISATEGWAVGSGGTILHYSGGQWKIANAPIINGAVDLYSISMVSATEGWAVGMDFDTKDPESLGLILHFSGGQWSKVDSPTLGNYLTEVAMVSTSEGWAVGIDGTVLHYSAGQWSKVNSPSPGLFLSISMVSATDGWAFGDNGTIFHYSGGQWKSVNSSTTDHLFSISMVSTTEGWAVGTDNTGTHGAILHYSGGQWKAANSPSTDVLTSISMVSSTDGWAVGGDETDNLGVILHYSAD